MATEDNHYQLSDAEFARQFKSLSLNPAWFTHEAHLRLGWIYVQALGIEKGAEQLCTQIREFDRKFGEGEKYNKTITVALAFLIYNRQMQSDAHDFPSFVLKNQDLLTNYKDLLAEHYSIDIFSANLPPETMLEPDLKPF